MPTITSRIPTALSERIAAGSPGTGGTGDIFNPQGREFDVAIGGIPFRLATMPDLNRSIETIAVNRDQLDTENDPGEQSLTSWWRRSQSSWHGGAGDLYQENADRTVDGTTFYDSEGVDVFTKGRISLLKKMQQWDDLPIGCSHVRTFVAELDDPPSVSAVHSDGLYAAGMVGGNTQLVHSVSELADAVVSGSTFYDVTTTGTLYKGLTSAPGSATTWPLGSGPQRLAWGKHRLWVIGGRKLWQPDLSLAGGTTQDPIFTHPNAGWTFTCLAEGSSAMLFGGHDGYSSTIQSVGLENDGSLPTLTGASVTAALPDGELVQELAVLAGQYVGIGTNRGFRVGLMDTGGAITYGPLLIEPVDTIRCTSITTQGRFFLVGFSTAGGRAVAYRIDTGENSDNLVFPYAKDIDCGSGALTSLSAPTNSTLVATSSDGHTYYQSTTEFVGTGFLQTGRVRYRTTEAKSFKFLEVEIEPLSGSINVEVVKEGESVLTLGSITNQGHVFEDRLAVNTDPMKYASVRFELVVSNDGLGSPVITSYQLRALPAVAPQRMIKLPLMCYDREKAQSGQWYGGQNYGADRVTGLQILEDTADSVLFQDFTSSQAQGRTVVIDSIQFVETVPNLPFRAATGGNGGIIILQLRTIDS